MNGAETQAKVITRCKAITEGMTPHDVAALKHHAAVAECLKEPSLGALLDREFELGRHEVKAVSG